MKRLVFYNIRYGTGGKAMAPWSGYLSNTDDNLGRIKTFLGSLDPDIVGLVEVDSGSYRTGWRNQPLPSFQLRSSGKIVIPTRRTPWPQH